MKIWKKNLVAAAVLVTVCAGIYVNWLYTEDLATAELTSTLDEQKLMSQDMLVMSGEEGVLYKNVVGTYLHGPLLPKNPHVCDYLIQNALERKYGVSELAPLDDAQEKAANQYIVDRFVKAEKK